MLDPRFWLFLVRSLIFENKGERLCPPLDPD